VPALLTLVVASVIGGFLFRAMLPRLWVAPQLRRELGVAEFYRAGSRLDWVTTLPAPQLADSGQPMQSDLTDDEAGAPQAVERHDRG
jgi:hypothetical protein